MQLFHRALASGALVLSLSFLGCASTTAQWPEPRMRQQRLASIQPVLVPEPPSEPAPPEAASYEGESAASLLERGFAYFRQEELGRASEAFKAAVATGHLNDAGRTLAYWHIYLAERSQGNVDAGAEALAAFVTVGEEVVEMRASQRFAVDSAGDFVDRFDLERRLARARATLSATWANRQPGFGRTPERPVLIHDDAEKTFFLEMAPPCHRARSREVIERPIAEEGVVGPARVTVSCEHQRVGTDYYFESVGDDLTE